MVTPSTITDVGEVCPRHMPKRQGRTTDAFSGYISKHSCFVHTRPCFLRWWCWSYFMKLHNIATWSRPCTFEVSVSDVPIKLSVHFEKLESVTANYSPGFRMLCPWRWAVWAASLKSVIDNYTALQELWDWSKDEALTCLQQHTSLRLKPSSKPLDTTLAHNLHCSIVKTWAKAFSLLSYLPLKGKSGCSGCSHPSAHQSEMCPSTIFGTRLNESISQ